MNIIDNLSGSIVAIVTPFTSTGTIDFPALQHLIEFQIHHGTDGIVVCGTTGESPTITPDEYGQLIRYVVQKVAKRIPVIAGSGANSTQQAITQSRVAQRMGADGLLVINPYYNKPTNKGIYSYFSKVATSVDLPIIMYNVPGRTASNMSAELSRQLANDFSNIIGIKEASGNLVQVMELIKSRPQGFKVYSGDDVLALSIINLGGDGCISVVANQIPKQFNQLVNAALDGDYMTARRLHYQYLNLMNLNFIECNPVPVKTSLHMMGLIDDNYRSPMCPMESEENYSKLRQELQILNLIEEPILASVGG